MRRDMCMVKLKTVKLGGQGEDATVELKMLKPMFLEKL